MSYNTGGWQREDTLPHTDPAEAVRGRQRCENCPGQGWYQALPYPGRLALSPKTTGFPGDFEKLRPQEAEHVAWVSSNWGKGSDLLFLTVLPFSYTLASKRLVPKEVSAQPSLAPPNL